MGPETLILQPARISTAQPLELGHDWRKLLDLNTDQLSETVTAERRSKIAQGVNNHRERQDLLHLGGLPAQHQMPIGIGSHTRLVKQTCFTDARLTAQRDDRRPTILQLPQRLGQRLQLCSPANDRRLQINDAARNVCHGDCRALDGGIDPPPASRRT